MTQAETTHQNPAHELDGIQVAVSRIVALAEEAFNDLACHVQEGGESYSVDEWAHVAMRLEREWRAVKASYGPDAIREAERAAFHRGQIKLMDEMCSVLNDLLDGKFEKRYGLLDPWGSTHDRLVARLRGEPASDDDGWVLMSERAPVIDESLPSYAQHVRCLVNLESGEVLEAQYTRNAYAKTEKGRLPRWEREGRILTLPVHAWKPMPTGPRKRKAS